MLHILVSNGERSNVHNTESQDHLVFSVAPSNDRTTWWNSDPPHSFQSMAAKQSFYVIDWKMWRRSKFGLTYPTTIVLQLYDGMKLFRWPRLSITSAVQIEDLCCFRRRKCFLNWYKSSGQVPKCLIVVGTTERKKTLCVHIVHITKNINCRSTGYSNGVRN